MANYSSVLFFLREWETSSRTCRVILVSPSGHLITWSPSGTSHRKAPRKGSLSLWEVGPVPSPYQAYKALLAYLILFDITSGGIPTGYAASELRLHYELHSC